jgi:hypothetical protein
MFQKNYIFFMRFIQFMDIRYRSAENIWFEMIYPYKKSKDIV